MIKRLSSMLPINISELIGRLDKALMDSICEIRLRENAPLSVSTYTKNLMLDKSGNICRDICDSVVCTSKDVAYLVNRLCEGSVYRYMSTLNSGYIVTPEGIRAGICGECIYDGARISAVSRFTSVNLRIPHEIDGVGDSICRYMSKKPHASVLLCSPPGYGKTTAIRSIAKGIATGRFAPPRRVAVIDERGEILPKGSVGLIDRFSGYRKSDGIEIATRLFSPELIVCDEIGHSDDVNSLLAVQNNGVPLLATTHGESFDGVMRRPNIKKLMDSCVFDAVGFIEKTDSGSNIRIEEVKA